MAGPECICFALDIDLETGLEAVRGCTRLDVLKQTILTLAAAKRRADSQHMFCLATLQEAAKLVLPPTTSLEALTAAVAGVHPSPMHYSAFELGSLGPLVKSAAMSAAVSLGCPVADAPPVRVVLLYCRSCTVPRMAQPPATPVAVDVLYMHEKPLPGANCPQEVFTALEEQCDLMAQAAGHQAYIYECNAGNIKKWLNIMLWMLCHPRQRRPQLQLPLAPPDLSQLLAHPNSTNTSIGSPTLLLGPTGPGPEPTSGPPSFAKIVASKSSTALASSSSSFSKTATSSPVKGGAVQPSGSGRSPGQPGPSSGGNGNGPPGRPKTPSLGGGQ